MWTAEGDQHKTKMRTRVRINARKTEVEFFFEKNSTRKNCCGLRKGINTKSNTKIVSADSGLNRRTNEVEFLFERNSTQKMVAHEK